MFTLTHVYAKYYKTVTCYENWQAKKDLFTIKKKKEQRKKEKNQTKPQSESVQQST